MPPSPYHSLIASLTAFGLNARVQAPGQLVISTQPGPVWPDRGNSFWLTCQNETWYLSTWVPFGYQIPAATDLTTLCLDCMRATDRAMGRVPQDLVSRYALRELSDDEYQRMIDHMPPP